jgi:hemolysin type calcium-binding protein
MSLMRVCFLAAALLSAAPATAAAGGVPPHPLAIDLPAEGQRVLEDSTGAVGAAGDVNGDGVTDVFIGGSSAVYVVFGPLGGTPVNPAALGDRGFVVEARPTDTLSSPDAAGDVNGDGLEDLVIAAGNSCDQLNPTFVVFGKRDTNPVDLANLGNEGFRIDGSEAPTSDTGYCAGGSMIASGAGDFNTDGRADVIVADFGVDGLYVVFGKPDSDAVAVDSLGSAGIRIDFPDPFTLDGGLDANGDGVTDVVVGGRYQNFHLMPDFARVLFGGPDATIAQGFSILGRTFVLNPGHSEELTDLVGTSVAMIGDLNADGLAEIALGAANAPSLDYVPPSSGRGETDFGGAVFVVFGRRSTSAVDPYDLGDGGYRVGGGGTEIDPFGGSVGRAGDVNGDGLDDIVISGRRGYPEQSSFGWTVFGKNDSAPQAVTAQSRATDVPDRYLEVVSASGGVLVGVGDQTGDGRGDLLMGGSLITGPPPPLLQGACANEVPVDPRGTPFYRRSYAPLSTTYATNAGDRLSGTRIGERVEALRGDDCVFGGDGHDELLGGDGKDRLIGGGDGNFLYGGPGRDRLKGGGGLDRLYGGPGRDRLVGRFLPDRLRGGPGRDVILGGRAFDRIYAVDGFADVVRCGAHRDRARVDALDRTIGCEKVQLLKPP